MYATYFKDLNLFLAEELVPLQAQQVVQLNDITVDKDDGTNVGFKALIIDPLKTQDKSNLYNNKIIKELVSVLDPFFNQVINLLTDPQHQLSHLIKLTTNISPSMTFKQALIQWKNESIVDAEAHINMLFTKLYDGINDYVEKNNDNIKLETNTVVIDFSLSSSEAPRFNLSNPIMHQATLGNDYKPVPLQLNDVQIKSLYRLTWAIESICKIKTKQKTVIYLDNMQVQMEHMMSNLYLSRLQTQFLAPFTISPYFNDYANNERFKVVHWFRYLYNSDYRKGDASVSSVYGDYPSSLPILIDLSYAYYYFERFFLKNEKTDKM